MLGITYEKFNILGNVAILLKKPVKKTECIYSCCPFSGSWPSSWPHGSERLNTPLADTEIRTDANLFIRPKVVNDKGKSQNVQMFL